MVSLEFDDYVIESMSYRENQNFDKENSDSMDIEIEFKADVAYKEEFGLVIFHAVLGDESNPNCPFLVEVVLQGLFTYQLSEDEKSEDDDLRTLMTSNAIAILYPYMRSLISDLTLRSNNFPSFSLPIINVVEMMKKNDMVKIYDLDTLRSRNN